MSVIRLSKSHFIYNNQIRCTICNRNILLNEKIYVDTVHTLTHQQCGCYRKTIDSGTLKEIIAKHPKWFPLDH